jgi:hypothetical protein
MKPSIVEWKSSGLRGAMYFSGIGGVPDLFAALGRGEPVSTRWTPKAHLRVDKDFKKHTLLGDAHDNLHNVIVASARLQAFLRAQVNHLELLPVTLLGVTGAKKISTEYAVVNVLSQEDCVDVKASKGTFNRLAPDQLLTVDSLVLNEKKLSKGANLFRLKHVGHKVFATAAFARLLEAEGFTNVSFWPPRLH